MGDVVLILKSEQEFDQKYQYVNEAGTNVFGLLRLSTKTITKNNKRRTFRGAREVIVIHKVDELPSNEVR